MAADGEAIYDRFWLIKDNPLPSVPVVDVPQVKQCCNDFMLLALADVNTNDPLKNDVAGFLWQLPEITTEATIELIKDGETIEVLDNDDFGTFYPLGFFINTAGKKFIGYQLKWKNVLEEHGPGKYKVMVSVNLSIGGLTGAYYSPDYCLYQYTPYRADGTIRIEYNNSGVMGVAENDFEIIDRGELFWYNSYRLPGWFGFPTATYEETRVKYNSGDTKYVTDDQDVEYELQIKFVPHFVHEIMRTEAMQADLLQITDYNGRNANNYVQKQVYKKSEYKPDWQKMKNKCAPVTVVMVQRVNNLRKLRQ